MLNGAKYLAGFIKENKHKYIPGILVILCVNVLQIITPRIIGNGINYLETGGSGLNVVGRYALYILLVSIGIFILTFLWRMLIMGAAVHFDYEIRGKLFSHLEKLSIKFFDKHKTGDIMARATNDIKAIMRAMSFGIALLADTVFITAFTLFILFTTVDVRLTLYAILPFSIIIILVLYLSKHIRTLFMKVQESFSLLTDKTQETISGIRVVQAFCQEKYEEKNFEKVNQYNFDCNMGLIKYFGFFIPLIKLITSLSLLVVLIYGGRLVVQGNIMLGDFFAFNMYIGLLIRPVAMFGMIMNLMQTGRTSFDRILEYMNAEPEITDKDADMAINHIAGEIEFRYLNFNYMNSEEVLKNINLKIPAGSTLAVIGRTGSGKSTFVKLLLRLYDVPERGRLLIDGRDIREIPLKTLRERTGYVPQDNFLFSKSIKENIAFGIDRFNDEMIEEAARISNVYEDIMDFPHKFDTVLGERGVNISGGQKQRISISRALIKNPDILILDDCLSAVDTQTEEKILNSLKHEMKKRTSIIISHRVSTVKFADEIIVIDKGSIVERGTHDSLLRQGGLYRDLYEKQLLEEKLESEQEVI